MYRWQPCSWTGLAIVCWMRVANWIAPSRSSRRRGDSAMPKRGPSSRRISSTSISSSETRSRVASSRVSPASRSCSSSILRKSSSSNTIAAAACRRRLFPLSARSIASTNTARPAFSKRGVAWLVLCLKPFLLRVLLRAKGQLRHRQCGEELPCAR